MRRIAGTSQPSKCTCCCLSGLPGLACQGLVAPQGMDQVSTCGTQRR